MIVSFDETYDNDHHCLLYGALFAPPTSHLHQRFLQVRRELNFRPEVKYTRCRNERNLKVCKRVIGAFMDDEAFFRCVVVEQYGFDYSGFARPDEPNAIAQARAYKKFAEMLLHLNVKNITNAVFLADKLTRCRGDDFLEQIRERFNPTGAVPTFRHLAEVDSEIEEYQCLQICDLLVGCVLNNLKPTGNPFKNEIRQYLCSRLGVRNFLLTTWKNVPLVTAQDPATKFNVWYWGANKKPR